jgi:ABC-type sulfate transport system permease subunit
VQKVKVLRLEFLAWRLEIFIAESYHRYGLLVCRARARACGELGAHESLSSVVDGHSESIILNIALTTLSHTCS